MGMIFFCQKIKNRVSSRLLAKIRVSQVFWEPIKNRVSPRSVLLKAVYLEALLYYEIIKLFRVWWFCKNGTKSAHFMLIFSQNSVNKSCLLGSAHSKVCLMKYCNEREVYNCIILQKYRIKGLHPQIFV